MLAKLLQPMKDREEERKRVIQEQFDELLRNLDQQRLQGKHFVAIQTNYMLDSSVSFSQSIFKDQRLVTIIGERHDLTWKCPEDSLTVAQYCKMAVERNQKCRVMLEFHPSMDPSINQSETIKTVFTSLQSINKTSQIISFDKRDDFLTRFYHENLYHSSPADFIAFGHEKVFNHYVKTFYDNYKLFDLDPKTDPDITRYLHDTFLKDIISHFDYIRDKLNKHEDLQNIRDELWHAWMKVCDFFILKDILGPYDIDEYIVIVGKNHTHNLDQILPTIPYLTTLNFQDGKNQSDCVTLFQSYLV
jgi:hypothetical protein